MSVKSSVETIRQRFDADVERFANAATGQTTTMDSGLVLDLLSAAIPQAQAGARRMLDIGCGGGNFSLRCLEGLPGLECSLADLSAPMLERAQERIQAAGGSIGQVWQADIRTIELPAGHFDLVTAAAVLHHLRLREEWRTVLADIHRSLTPGGSFWFWDLVRFDDSSLQSAQTARWSAYLENLGGPAYRDQVFAYVEEEDSPESTGFILKVLFEVGFATVDVVHQNGPFTAIMARKARGG